MRKITYLNPVTYAALANDIHAGETVKGRDLRAFRRYVSKGLEAAVALALDVPGVYVNPYHPDLSEHERWQLHAAGR